MAILRSLRALARNSNSRNLFPKPPSPSPQFQSHPSIFSQNSSNPFFPSRTPRFLSPLSKFFVPIHASLLLLSSPPPWQLSHSTTPLHFQCDVVSIAPPALNLLRTREFSAVNLGLESAVAPIVRNLNGDGSGGGGGGGDSGGGLVDSWVNLPNLISFSRLLSGPFLGWMIVQEMYLPAFVGLAISGATDWLDGYVARKMGINSVVGSYLDPLADKVLIGCVALAMVDMGLLHPGLVGLIVARDLALVSGAVYKRASDLDWKWTSWSDFFNLDGARPQKVEPLFISKVNTALQLLLVTAALLEPEFGTQETASYITYLSWLVASTTLASTAAYGSQYLRNKSTMLQKRV